MKLTRNNRTTRMENGGGLRKLSPMVRLPAPSILARLSPDDRALLEKRLREPCECIYHPSFRSKRVPGLIRREPPVTCPVLLDLDREDVTVSAGADVLTAEEERQLFFRFNYCRYQVMRILRGRRGRRLTSAATSELLEWEHLADETRTQIVRFNTSLVLAMARRSRNRSVELGELVSEGNLALLRCVDKFDASRGFKFSTYACRAILASFARTGTKAARHRSQFPTPYDPAMERSDYIERKRDNVELECVDELKRILFENLAELSAVEREVLNARFSLDQKAAKSGARRQTLDQVGAQLGVSKERVRQIQNQAMIKLRGVLEDRLLAS